MKNEHTSARVGKIASRVNTMTRADLELFVATENGWKAILSLSGSVLTQIKDKAKAPK